ncbi:hypothetical protein [Acrocarpospora sp. B8E8]
MISGIVARPLPPLIDALRAGPFTVTAMGEAELRRAIIGPLNAPD